jgi:hypothetical protein
MVNIVQAIIVIIAGIAVAIADGLIKKAAGGTTFITALGSPLMLGALVLYILQILFFTYVFVKDWQLGVVGILQMVAYSIFVVSTGVFFFGESLTTTQIVGLILAVGGAVLLNL